jgi:N-acyl-D-aspartate/D-glutamate deacylase
MYPYDFWATYLASPRFNDGWQERFRISYEDLQIAGTTERLTETTFRSHQAENKLAAAFAIPEADVRTCLKSPFVMIGSDAIFTDGNNHPRATGCFARTLGRYVRDEPVIGLREALAKMTIMPALRLQARVPALQKKGRLQRGADADITVFDPKRVMDRSTIENPGLASAGIEHVLILGQVVKTPDGIDESKRLGQPVKLA